MSSESEETGLFVLLVCQPCPFCGKAGELLVTEGQLAKYYAGAFVQDAFPGMSPGNREMIISGTHSVCWDKYIPEMED